MAAAAVILCRLAAAAIVCCSAATGLRALTRLARRGAFLINSLMLLVPAMSRAVLPLYAHIRGSQEKKSLTLYITILIAQTEEEIYGSAVGCTGNVTHTITLLAMIRNVCNRSN